ncbi:hypothetical protein LTR53_003191 [Teratosphaeriaceae sp. CCFEE 6253]|nr:hypothetical protein LTR53_003191 [Teratosphaeriaceae sp. CCFEE 6253]
MFSTTTTTRSSTQPAGAPDGSGAAAAGTPANPDAAFDARKPDSGDNVDRTVDDTTLPPSLPPIPSTPSRTASFERNQAPGLLRRQATKGRQPDRSRSRTSGIATKRGGPPIRVTMADLGAELRAKDGETPGAESDTFEDAVDVTSRVMSPEPATYGIMKTNGEVTGLAIDGAEGKSSSTVYTNGAPPAAFEPTHSRQATLDITPALPTPLPERERSVSPGKQLHGLSGDFAVAAPPPPSTADRIRALEQRPPRERPAGPTLAAPQPQAETLARKASSGFAGLLGRMGSIRKTARSPPAPRQESRFAAEGRRPSTMGVIGEGTTNGLAPIVDESETRRPSLRDQFQSLRRQEEATENGVNGHAMNDDADRTPMARTRSDAGILDAASDSDSQPSPPRLDRSASTPNGLLKSPPLDKALPPGTASGMSAGPADEPRPVNWDLWQSVVYEGPAAVKRTSGAELQEAIACGIPAAIRGVVWQVLAESKNEELETVYRTLKARGSPDAADPPKPAPMSRADSQNAFGLTNGTTSPEHDSLASSASSTHSAHSTQATSAMASPPATGDPTHNPLDLQGKLLLAEKHKREAALITKLEKCIRRDLGARTSFSKYTQAAGLQDALFGVCKAYALFDEGVGYAQGINFIAMPLLFLMSEEEAFTLLVKLMSRYDIRSMFTPDMAGLHLRLYQFERLLEDSEPALYCHLRRRKVDPGLYATQWFLALFAYRFPLQLVLRVYDLILTEGLTAILKFGITLMQRNRETLLGMADMSALSVFLKEKLFDVYIDKAPSASSLLDSGFFGSVTGGADKELYRADELVRDACGVVIADARLAQYTAEWEEQTRVERARAEEVETLRAANAHLGARLKALEERTQEQDTEHVALAGELVRGKVELDGALDENEGLKMQMEELRRLVDVQPAEVEARLRGEMERIMGRNVEVQNENRGLKEEMVEMEQELVGAKMGLAQAQADRDTLQQRVTGIQALLNGNG